MSIELIEKIYSGLCSQQSDINEHLPVLRKYSTGCDLVVELGTRDIISTWGLLAALPKKLISVDIVVPQQQALEVFSKIAKDSGVDFQFLHNTTTYNEQYINNNIPLFELTEEPDFLFIDTYHEYNQLKEELDRFGNKTKKYLGFHDTATFGTIAQDGGIGLWPAIEEFLDNNPHWEIEVRLENNNGLTVLKRR